MEKKYLKNKIHTALVSELVHQVSNYERLLDSIRQSKNSDTKSSAGDKFETGREMMQMEIDKTDMLLNKVNYALEILNQLDIEDVSETVGHGSLVECDTGIFYISIGHGSIKVDGQKYYAISTISPVGKLLMGKKKGDDIVFNNKTIKILNVE